MRDRCFCNGICTCERLFSCPIQSVSRMDYFLKVAHAPSLLARSCRACQFANNAHCLFSVMKHHSQNNNEKGLGRCLEEEEEEKKKEREKKRRIGRRRRRRQLQRRQQHNNKNKSEKSDLMTVVDIPFFFVASGIVWLCEWGRPLSGSRLVVVIVTWTQCVSLRQFYWLSPTGPNL